MTAHHSRAIGVNVMANKTINVNAVCPFFASEGQATITCEGVIGKWNTTRFLTVSDKLEHEDLYCCCDYASCPIYKAVMTKYSSCGAPEYTSAKLVI